MSIIEITNLTKYYGKARGIEDVSCSVEEGEIFGFIGPNGAGKSTTIRLLLSLIHPTSGSARVLGKDVVTHGPEIRRDIGYLPSEVYYYEGMRGSDILSKEERDKTVEFSLVLPVSRSRVVTAKALAALVNCLAFVLITWVVSLVAVQSYNPDRAFLDFLALEMQAMLAIELIFLAIGLLLGAAMKQYKLSGSTAVAIILTTYFLSIVVSLQDNLDFLKYFTPFKYFDAGELFRSGTLDGVYLLLTAAIIVVCMAAAYWTYNKRDLYI